MRLKLVFSYDGSKFQGSQTQPHENGVEDALGAALAHVGIFGKIVSSSRTDKGVHANNQVACVECGEHFRDFARLKSLINRHAHPAVHVKFISRARDDFHPRYDATARAYRYVVNHGEFSPFLAPYETFLPRFDVRLANELLALFVGEHDFSAFMKLGSDVKSPVRRVAQAFCYERGERTITVFKANGFLRAQVRLMVASVLKALELAKNGKFKQTDAPEFKFERGERVNLSANSKPTLDKDGVNLCLNLGDNGKFDTLNLTANEAALKFDEISSVCEPSGAANLSRSDALINGDENKNTALNLTQTTSPNAEQKVSGGDANLNKNADGKDKKISKDTVGANENENLGASADESDLKNANFLKAKELLRQAIYEQKPLTRIPAPPNGLYLNRVFYR